MSDGSLLAVDAGTGSCRAILFDIAGRQIAVAQREWSHAALPAFPGSQVFDTDANWRSICACIREAIDEAGISADAILAVCSTSMREGMVLYDAADREIWACPNVDARATDEATKLVRDGLAERIYFTGGDWVAITAPPRLRWLRRHEPELFERVAHLTMLGDWIAFKLCGEYATDPSLGSSSGMFDLARRTWSDETIALCDLQPAVFPQVREPGSVAGVVHRQGAAAAGLRAGTPVVVGGADTQLGLVGIGRVEPGQFTVVGGSFWQHTIGLDRPLIDPESRLRTLCHTLPGQWMMEGIGFYSGLTMRWFRDGFYGHEKVEAGRQGQDPYALMEREAALAPPGANGVLGLFSNLMDAKRWIHAAPAFLQFDIGDPDRSGKKECVRAIEESAAYVSRGHFQIIESLVGEVGGEVVFTGGAAKGTLWPRILADVLNRRVIIPSVRESTALGAALYAGLGAGLYDDLATVARQVVRFDATYEPDPATHAAYLDLYDQWSRVYRRSLALVDEGLVRPLWRAAGA